MKLNILQQTRVLEVNTNYQAISHRTVGEAMILLCKGAVVALHVSVDPVTRVPELGYQMDWEAWIGQELIPGVDTIHTPHREIMVPEVIVDRDNTYMPKVSLSLDLRGIYIRDRGVDQYTGQPVAWEDASIDHVIPRHQGGETTWENCVLAHKEVNNRKANQTPAQAGLELLRKPARPGYVPVCAALKAHSQRAAWAAFFV